LTVLPLALAQVAGREAIVVMTQPEGWQRWVSVLESIAIILIAVALIAIALALIAAALQSRKIYGKVHTILDRVHADVKPIIGHATDVAENVNYMSTAIRADVDELRAALEKAQDRLTSATHATEQRIRQFNALVKLVQEEAEELFIDTASTVRGVQAGARALREGPGEETQWSTTEAMDPAMRPARRPRPNP
jgi:uncharacterized protein YoxC